MPSRIGIARAMATVLWVSWFVHSSAVQAAGQVVPSTTSSAAPRHLIRRLSIRHRRSRSAVKTAGQTILLNAPLAGGATDPNRFLFAGSTCITAGTAATPATSVPACGASAALDVKGAGALQLTPPQQNLAGFLAVQNPIFPTEGGLVITFTDYSFGGTVPSADGVALFLSDASQPIPTTFGQVGGSLGYAGGSYSAGIANAYLGIGLDEYGNFSNPIEGRNGGPGFIPETVAVRGASTVNYPYLTGAQGANGAPASLPFNFDQPTSSTRPRTAPTVQVTLTPQGTLSVAIDIHDGNGFLDDIAPTNVVGLSGQPPVPATVYLGFTSSTGGLQSSHQIGNLTVATLSTLTTPTTQDNTTYHRNNARTGWYRNETMLTAATVGSTGFHLVGSLTTAGKSYSQPLYLTAQKLADGTTHNVLIITDSTDVVYAFDADSLATLWQRDFKGPGIRQQLASDINCDDTWPNLGINGTPVIDRVRNEMYVVVPTNENGTPHLRLHALSLLTGADAVAPVEVAASVTLQSGGVAAIDPAYNFNRAGLLEANSTVYVALGTHCDYDSDASHGWVLAYNSDTLATMGSTMDTTDKDLGTVAGVRFLGGVWQGGFGIAADAQNNIYFATGNGPNDNGGSDYGMSVVKLPPSLSFAQRSFFTPSTWENESENDADLGSGGVMLLPKQTAGPYANLAIAGGKTGMKYLLNRDRLGGLNAVDRIPYEARTGGGIWGGPAYFVDSTGAQKILYGGTPTLNAYTLVTSPVYNLVQTSATTVGSLENRNAGITPIVSSNGTQAGSAVVWGILTPPGSTVGAVPISLYAFDASNLATTLFTATAGQWTGNGDTGGALITPLVANGRVYLATDGVVTVFGLR